MTAANPAPRSPAGHAAPVNGSLRMHAHASLPRPGGGEWSTTERHHMEEAARRARALRAQAAVLLCGGEPRAAFNFAIQGLQAAMARESQRRPGDIHGLCEFFVEQFASLVERLRAVEADRRSARGGPAMVKVLSWLVPGQPVPPEATGCIPVPDYASDTGTPPQPGTGSPVPGPAGTEAESRYSAAGEEMTGAPDGCRRQYRWRYAGTRQYRHAEGRRPGACASRGPVPVGVRAAAAAPEYSRHHGACRMALPAAFAGRSS